MAQAGSASLAIAEMREFAAFTAAEQRYLRRSLDVGLARADAFRRWGQDEYEIASIRRQYLAYQGLEALRAAIPPLQRDSAFDGFMGELVRLAAFDLSQGWLEGFPPFRFLYERLLGPQVRPWLPAAFCAAATLPQIDPQCRRRLLHSISEAAATATGWSLQKPFFYPDWIDEATPVPRVDQR